MRRIDHVNIVVADMDRSVRFYSEMLGLRRGFERILEGEWVERVTGLPGVRAHCVFMVGDDASARLELLQYLTPEGEAVPANSLPNTQGIRHLGFEVDDLDALVEHLRSAGVAVQSDPVPVPFAVGNLGRKRLVYFFDPDGTVLELAAYGDPGAAPPE